MLVCSTSSMLRGCIPKPISFFFPRMQRASVEAFHMYLSTFKPQADHMLADEHRPKPRMSLWNEEQIGIPRNAHSSRSREDRLTSKIAKDDLVRSCVSETPCQKPQCCIECPAKRGGKNHFVPGLKCRTTLYPHLMCETTSTKS